MPETILTKIEGDVATVTLNRPETMNTLDLEMAERLPAAIEDLAFDSAVRAIVLEGAGPNFMAGGDIRAFEEHLGRGTHDDLVDAVRNFQRAAKLLRRAPKPILAKVRGACAGGGLSLMLACDLAIAAESSMFSVAYTRIGAPPDGGLTYHLPRTVGLRKAIELAFLSDRFGAAAALEMGLVNWVVPDAELDARTIAMAQRLAAGPTRALARTKALMSQAYSRDMSDQLEGELEGFVNAFAGSPDFAEGVHAFVQKREPSFRGK